jgi:hypothetical protein
MESVDAGARRGIEADVQARSRAAAMKGGGRFDRPLFIADLASRAVN